MINEYYYEVGIEESAIRKLFGYGLKRQNEVGPDKVYDYSLGNPSIPTPEVVTNKIKELTKLDPLTLHSYSIARGYPESREKIAKSYQKEFNFPATADNVLITNGAAHAIVISICAVTHPGDEIIVITPYFAEYTNWIKQAYCQPVKVMANQDNFLIDTEAVKNAITEKTSAIIINSPNNPTGVIYTEQNLKDLANVLNEAGKKFGHPIYLISDEPYRKLAYGKTVPFIPAIYNNTIMISSASKFLSLPGERIGHIYVSDTMQDAFTVNKAVEGSARCLGHVCPTTLFQRVYGDCFDVEPDLRPYETNRKLLTDILDEFGYKYITPDGAFYLWVKSPIKDSIKFSDIAKRFDLLIVASNSFGTEGWLRLSYCVPTLNIKNSYEAFKKLDKYLKENKLI